MKINGKDHTRFITPGFTDGGYRKILSNTWRIIDSKIQRLIHRVVHKEWINNAWIQNELKNEMRNEVARFSYKVSNFRAKWLLIFVEDLPETRKKGILETACFLKEAQGIFSEQVQMMKSICQNLKAKEECEYQQEILVVDEMLSTFSQTVDYMVESEDSENRKLVAEPVARGMRELQAKASVAQTTEECESLLNVILKTRQANEGLWKTEGFKKNVSELDKFHAQVVATLNKIIKEQTSVESLGELVSEALGKPETIVDVRQRFDSGKADLGTLSFEENVKLLSGFEQNLQDLEDAAGIVRSPSSEEAKPAKQAEPKKLEQAAAEEDRKDEAVAVPTGLLEKLGKLQIEVPKAQTVEDCERLLKLFSHARAENGWFYKEGSEEFNKNASVLDDFKKQILATRERIAGEKNVSDPKKEASQKKVKAPATAVKPKGSLIAKRLAQLGNLQVGAPGSKPVKPDAKAAKAEPAVELSHAKKPSIGGHKRLPSTKKKKPFVPIAKT